MEAAAGESPARQPGSFCDEKAGRPGWDAVCRDTHRYPPVGEAGMSLLDKLFPPEPGVGIFGRIFLATIDSKPGRAPLFGPASSWTQRKAQESPPDAYAPKIVRHHAPWPHQSWPGGGGGPGSRPGRTGSGREWWPTSRSAEALIGCVPPVRPVCAGCVLRRTLAAGSGAVSGQVRLPAGERISAPVGARALRAQISSIESLDDAGSRIGCSVGRWSS